MIDINKAKEVFKEYVKNYDYTHPKIKMKIDHILRVSENSKIIALELGLNKDDQDLAELIGLLHDIGRFEQIRQYNTFMDKLSINHALQGVKVLFDDGLIRKFIKEEKYDEIIYKAIINHNKDQIEEGLSPKEELHCKIIRDSDKLDIYRVIVETPKLEDVLSFKTEDLSKERITDEIYDEYLNREKIDYSKIKTNMDIIISWFAYIYDFNFKESLLKIKNEDYINKIFNRIKPKEEETKKQLENVRKIALVYIN